MKHCQDNLADVTLESLAEFMGYTTVYTGKIIKNSVGKSFSAYIQDLRCEKAAQLLCETDLSVSEVINSVGYENGSFFRRIFKKRFGVNLLEYRKSNCN